MKMGFWKSELGEITGSQEDAFAQNFTIIPDGTTALAVVEKFTIEYYGEKSPNAGAPYMSLLWTLTDGDFRGRKIEQKIKAMDPDPKTRHRALNMLRLLYQQFKIQLKHANEPTNQDLMAFHGKVGGIKIRETEPNNEGKSFNWVSEVHPSKDFKSETGIKLVVTHNVNHEGNAFDRNPRGSNANLGNESDDDIPF